MKRKQFAEEQIIAVLHEHEDGAKAAVLVCKHGVSEATLYNCKAKYGGMDLFRRQMPEGLGGRGREAEEAAGRLDTESTSRASVKKWQGPRPSAKPSRICKSSWAC